MAAALEIRIHKHIHNLQRKLRCNKPRRQHKHIGIIVRTRQTRQLRRPAQSRTHTLMLIESHRDTIAAATHGNAGINHSPLNSKRTRMSKIRIIATRLTICAKIAISNTIGLKIALDYRLKLKTRVIATQPYRLTIN